jgi:proteasome lid subunit RPN8/RPN11
MAVKKMFDSGVPIKANLTISTSEEILQAILDGAKRLHPKEMIMLLRGKKTKNQITISELVVPPLATYGKSFANMRLHMLPMDFSIVGTVHSHPSGDVMPSHADLNHFFGNILMIAGFPYENESNTAVYDCDGEKLVLRVTKS